MGSDWVKQYTASCLETEPIEHQLKLCLPSTNPNVRKRFEPTGLGSAVINYTETEPA
jgi:hypothetical protein